MQSWQNKYMKDSEDDQSNDIIFWFLVLHLEDNMLFFTAISPKNNPGVIVAEIT